jgi:hypothetical protein
LYLGSRDLPNANVTVRGSIVYRNGIELKYGAIQHNGRVTNLRIEGNILHSNGQWGVTFAQGVQQSVVQNNLIFNNQGHGIILQLYPGHGEEACANGTGTICPYPQTDNLITNNTIWLGQSSSAAILVGRNDLGTPGDGLYDMGRNTVQNNVIVTGNGPMIRVLSAEWLDTWTVRRNVVFRRGGETAVIWYGAAAYTVPEFDATFALADGNRFADPQLQASDPALSATPDRFDFDLRDASPAIAFGTGTRAPTIDLRGRVRVIPPDAGAYVAPTR